MDDERFHTTNPLVTNEDINNHYGVGGVFHKGNKILLLWHNKYKFWTIPIGKVPLWQDPDDGFRLEMMEELGVWIPIYNMELLGHFTKIYHRGKNVYTRIISNLYDVLEYDGSIENREPEKHLKMEWFLPGTISTIPRNETSDMLRFYLALKEILECPTKKLIK